MTFSNFAGSLLLVLTLASLSALAPAAPRRGHSITGQTLTSSPATSEGMANTRVAMVDPRDSSRPLAAGAATHAGDTVPDMGEIVPETGQ